MWESTLSLCNNVSVLCFVWFLGFVVCIWEYYALEVDLCVSSSSVAILFPFLGVFIIV